MPPKKSVPHQKFCAKRKPNFMTRGTKKNFFWPCASSVPCRTRFQNDPNLGLFLRVVMYIFNAFLYSKFIKNWSKSYYQHRGMWWTSYPWPQDPPCVLQDSRKPLGGRGESWHPFNAHIFMKLSPNILGTFMVLLTPQWTKGGGAWGAPQGPPNTYTWKNFCVWKWFLGHKQKINK